VTNVNKKQISDLIKYNVCLKAYNTFGIDVSAARFIQPGSCETLPEICRSFPKEKFLFLGGGSNILFTQDFPGTVIHFPAPIPEKIASVLDASSFSETIKGQCFFLTDVPANVPWDAFAAWAVSQSLWGTECLGGIPGTAGAAPVQNIGAYGQEIWQIIDSVSGFDFQTGDFRVIPGRSCEWGYRNSIFKRSIYRTFFITSVRFRLRKESSRDIPKRALACFGADCPNNPAPSQIRNAVLNERSKKLPDPAVLPNAGSFFKNPVVSIEVAEAIQRTYPEMPLFDVTDKPTDVPAKDIPQSGKFAKIPAAFLIDKCGWKGRTLGRAGVHHLQPLVLVNRGNAEGKEILTLAEAVKESVLRTFGIDLETEVVVV